MEHYGPDQQPFDMEGFMTDATGYKSTFMPYAEVADMFIAGHYWAEGSPFLFTREDMKSASWNVKVVADVSCDIDGPVACTLRPSTIAEPLYGYNPSTESECTMDDPSASPSWPWTTFLASCLETPAMGLARK